MFAIKRAALTLSGTALAAGALLAVPSTATAATLPAATGATTSTRAPATAEAYTWVDAYPTFSECDNVGFVRQLRGEWRDYHCTASPTSPGGDTVEWNLWVLY
ncbi:hypothetical protein [Streptomyces odontomachi]|uniref:hypothetical protein n=1 Tax=Streptomyces odontomachi TaxID=2944940 RepID=UPI00210D85B6|nr:hypothetical protein [Streptomyces sp. ODS25]